MCRKPACHSILQSTCPLRDWVSIFCCLAGRELNRKCERGGTTHFALVSGALITLAAETRANANSICRYEMQIGPCDQAWWLVASGKWVSLISWAYVCNVDLLLPLPLQRNSSKVMSFRRDCQDKPLVSETTNICISVLIYLLYLKVL